MSNSAQAQSGSNSDVPEASQTPPPSSASFSESGGHGSPRRLATGVVLSGGRYRIENLVASGGMGAVYRAIDTRFNRPCAVKEMLDDFRNERERAQAVEWFSREATLLLDLNHPCIPRVRDFFAEEGRHYLVMDFIEGRTLADMLEIEGNVSGVNGARGITEEHARDWMRQLCGVLSYLHRQAPPIIFRDLKPSNIMVTPRNEIKLIDFGIARAFQAQQQATVIMTLGYAPPEQLHAMPEPRSDLYALGATVHRLLTRHDAANNKPNIFSFPPLRQLRPDISPAFEQVVMKALVPNLEHRWASADEMERAIINLPPITMVPPITSGVNNPLSGVRSVHTPNVPVSGPNSGSGGVDSNGPMSISSGPAKSTTTGAAGPHILAAQRHLVSGNQAQGVDAAYKEVMMAYSKEPNNSLVHKLFGQVYARRLPRTPDNVNKAMQAYQTSLRLNPNDAETHKLIGDVFLFLRTPPAPLQSIPAYTESLRLKSDDFEVHERLGQCFDKTSQLDAAVREYQEALRYAPAHLQQVRLRLFFGLGLVAFRANQLRIAEDAFVQVLVLNNADNQARFMLSQVYEREGKYEEAFTQCSYVLGPLGNANPAVPQLYNRLKQHLRR